MIPRLYTPLDLSTGLTLQLDPATSHHAVRVLRLGTGAAVELFDGNGQAACATITSTSPATARVDRMLVPAAAPALHVTLAQCISSADKMDWTIEKAVELGVSAIVPLQSHKAIVKLTAERATKRREHWQRLILAASAQSGQNRVPRLDEAARLEEWLAQAPATGDAIERTVRLILDPRAGLSLAALLGAHEPTAVAGENAATAPRAVWLLCGPEAGFSDAEYRRACEAGWLPAGLGPRVLRTETAGVAALAILQARWGDLR